MASRVGLLKMLQPAEGVARPGMPRRDQFVLVVLGTWLRVALALDGRAHHLGLQESFFSIWHTILYSGSLATAAWLSWRVAPHMRTSRAGGAALPAGYDLAILGLALFLLGGISDLLWHKMWGIEKELRVFLSPPHILVFLGLILLLSGPFRGAWAAPSDEERSAPSLTALLPAVLSITLAASVATFAFMYLWPFYYHVHDADRQLQSVFGNVLQTGGPAAAALLDVRVRHLVGSVLLSNFVLVAPLLLLLRRWHLPFGAATIYLIVMMAEIAWPSALVAGLAVDGMTQGLHPSPQRPAAFRLFATMVPLLLWSLYFLTLYLKWHISWPPEVWAGVIIWSGVSGFVLSVLVAPGGPGRSHLGLR